MARTVTDTPKQWRMVPVEPTYAMLDNARYFWGPWIDAEKTQRAGRRSEDPADVERARAVWEQMLAASPAPDLEGLKERVAQMVFGACQASAEWGAPDAVLPLAHTTADAILSLIFPEGEGRD